MYLSQLLLDRMSRQTMRTLADVYRLHQFVMSGFSAYENPSRVLFRVEPEVRGGMVQLLVQSKEKPEWLHQGGEEKGVLKIQTKELSPAFKREALFRFRLRANPVVTREGKRYGLIRDEALLDWLKKKEACVGASFSSVCIVDEGYTVGKRKRGERADSVNIKMARFEGLLKVEDPVRFSETFQNGIGPAKAFGCGLLSLARA